MYVCIYVNVYIIYVCLYVYIHTYIHTYIHIAHQPACARDASPCLAMYVCMHVCTCRHTTYRERETESSPASLRKRRVSVFGNVRMYICMHVCTCRHTTHNKHTHTHSFAHLGVALIDFQILSLNTRFSYVCGCLCGLVLSTCALHIFR
jgi:hypothetical protein